MNLAKRNSDAAKAWAEKRRVSKERALQQQRRRHQQQHQQQVAGCASSRLPVPSERRPTRHDEDRPPRHAAATSHEDNFAYMEEFGESMADMYLELEGSGSGDGTDGMAYLGGSLGSRTLIHSNDIRPRNDKRSVARREYQGCGRNRSERRTSLTSLADEFTGEDVSGISEAAGGWYTGPLDPAGQMVDLSDRNLLCASVLGDEAVFGCADHALYCVDLSQGTKTRQLYGSRSKAADAGHKEWVSVVSHTPLGDIVSGALDGKLCLWPRDSCGDPREVQAHTGSISAMKVDAEARVVTSGYGGALRVWDCRRSGTGLVGAPRMLGELSHQSLPAPCMDFAWCDSQVLTGHRDGRLGLFDLETGEMMGGRGVSLGRAHRGHVTATLSAPGLDTGAATPRFVTGGQDGFVRIWDPRVGELDTSSGSCLSAGSAGMVMESAAHCSSAGVGAVGGIIASEAGASGTRLISYGADKRICVLEIRGGTKAKGRNHLQKAATTRTSTSSLVIEHVFDEHRDFIYCMNLVSSASRGQSERDIIVSGGGDGMLLVHSLSSMRLLYGLGCCSAGAVRCAIGGPDRLTVAGDDGNAMLYKFGGVKQNIALKERRYIEGR